MTRLTISCLVALVLVGLSVRSSWAGHGPGAIKRAHWNLGAEWYNANRSWHGYYSHPQWGREFRPGRASAPNLWLDPGRRSDGHVHPHPQRDHLYCAGQ